MCRKAKEFPAFLWNDNCIVYSKNRVRCNKKQTLFANTWKHSQACSWETEKNPSGYLGKTVGLLADILNLQLQGEKHTAIDLITTARPFQKKFNIFKHVIQTDLSHFPRHLGKVKARRFQIIQFI